MTSDPNSETKVRFPGEAALSYTFVKKGGEGVEGGGGKMPNSLSPEAIRHER
jgi:hypothetical protein